MILIFLTLYMTERHDVMTTMMFHFFCFNYLAGALTGVRLAWLILSHIYKENNWKKLKVKF